MIRKQDTGGAAAQGVRAVPQHKLPEKADPITGPVLDPGHHASRDKHERHERRKRHQMRLGVGGAVQTVTTKRVEEEAERAADAFLIRFPKATVILTVTLEDGTCIEVTRGSEHRG